MARWDYASSTLNQSTNVLTIKDAVRLPKEDGTIEAEFLNEKGINEPRDIQLQLHLLEKTRGLSSARIDMIREVAIELGFTREYLIHSIEANRASRLNRIYGIARTITRGENKDKVAISIREEIFRNGTRDQIKEALDHEFREGTVDLTHRQV